MISSDAPSGPGRFTAVTIVRWSSVDDLPAARSTADAGHQAVGFDPARFFARTGIEPEIASSVEVVR